MLSLQKHHITELYCFVDDMLPQQETSVGRPAILNHSEIVTILLWNIMSHTRQQTLKDVYRWVQMEYTSEFPRAPTYNAFLDECHRVLPLLWALLERLLVHGAPLRFMDSTMVEVCKLIRADTHKVAKNIANFGKNHQGWHYGFKLHASITPNGPFSGIALTPASVYDAHMMPQILNERTKIAVGDTLYGASVMRKKIWNDYGTIIIAPPHPKQKKKIITQWQHLLLNYRPKIESVFDYLKNHLHLVSSFPRSVNGYLLHYLRILLGYQVMALTLA